MLRRIESGKVGIKKALFLLVSIAVFVSLPAVAAPSVASASGNTYYVAPGGNDSGPGTMDQPWGSIQKAANTLQAGDTVLIRGGTYHIPNSGPRISPANSGASGAYITFQTYPGESVTIQGNYPTVGDSVWYGFDIRGKSYIRIEGLTIRGFHAGVGVRAPSHHITVSNCILEYNSESGFSSTDKVSGTKDAGDYLSIEGNIIRWNGYYADGTPATRVYEGWGSGISINAHNNPYKFDNNPGFHTVIRGNYIYHNYDGTGGDLDNDPDHTDGNGIIIDRGGDLPPMLIENNIVFDNGGRGIHPFGSQNVWIVGNTLYNNGWDTEFLSPNTLCEIGGYAANSALSNIHILNNIVNARGNNQITYFPDIQPGILTMENNLWFGNPYRETYSPYGENYVRSDPQFVNASLDPISADFHLVGYSPAIDRGTDDLESGSGVTDFDGRPRPQAQGYDIGAYETAGQVYPSADYQVYVPIVMTGAD